MFESAPNGYFINDLLVFDGLRTGRHVSKGFLLEPADLSAAATEHLNAFQDQLRFCSPVCMRSSGYRFNGSAIRTIARSCCAIGSTDRASNVWTKRCRNERFARYWQAMLDRRLRRQRLVLYFSRLIDTSPPTLATASMQRGHYETLLQQVAT
jgi:hypothetical protein